MTPQLLSVKVNMCSSTAYSAASKNLKLINFPSKDCNEIILSCIYLFHIYKCVYMFWFKAVKI